MDSEDKILIDKYEVQIYNREPIYFDLTEFEIIISYYMFEAQYIEALEALVRAKMCHPDSHNLDLFKVEILMELDEYDQAMQLAEALDEPLSDRYELYFLKAQIYLELDDVKNAVKAFKTSLARTNDIENHEYFSEIYHIPEILMDKGLHKEAMYFLRKFIKADDKRADSLWHMAVCYEKTGAVDKAEKFYEKALDVAPFDEYIWTDFGLLYLNSERYEKALNAFEFALAIKDTGIPAIVYKSNVLMLMKEYDKAIEWIESLELIDAGSFYLLGKCYEEKQNIAKAVEHYINAIRKAPEFTPPYWCMAKIMYDANDAALAVKLIEKAMEYDPNNMEYMLMRTIYMMGMMLGFKVVAEDKANDEGRPCNNATAAALLFYLGDIEGCCKKIITSLFFDENAIENFFEQAPEAKENADVMNYLKVYIKK